LISEYRADYIAQTISD